MSKAELLLVGAGPVGCLLASALMQNSVCFDWYIRNTHVRAMAQSLQLQFPGELLSLSQTCVRYPASLPQAKYSTVITAAKSQQTENLMAGLPLATHARRLAVANGLISGDYHLGLLYGGAFLDGARLVTRRSNTLQIGSLGSIVDESGYFGGLLACEWLWIEVVEDVELLQWHKLCLNCVLNPLTALLDVPNGRMLEYLEGPLIRGLVHELQLVARRHLGRRWQYDDESIMAGVRALIEVTADNSSSMREDLRHHRVPEISRMNGAIARLGRDYDIPCPLNDAISELVIAVSANSVDSG